jgi:hypothetical protein
MHLVHLVYAVIFLRSIAVSEACRKSVVLGRQIKYDGSALLSNKLSPTKNGSLRTGERRGGDFFMR